MKRAAGRRMVYQLNRPNLDDAMAVQRVKAGCLGVEDNLTRAKSVPPPAIFRRR